MTKTNKPKDGELPAKVAEFLARLNPMRPVASPGPGATSEYLRDNLNTIIPAEVQLRAAVDMGYTDKAAASAYATRLFSWYRLSWKRTKRLKAPLGWLRVYESNDAPGLLMYVATDRDESAIYGVLLFKRE